MTNEATMTHDKTSPNDETAKERSDFF